MSDKPVPTPDADSEPFWAACRAGRLTAQQCSACHRFRWPPRGVCPACGAWSFAWQALSPRGTIQSFVVPHRAFNPAFAGDVPYVVAQVAIDGTSGSVVLIANVRGVDWSMLRVGQTVRVEFDRDGLPEFHPG
jgi:uncharacterized OB-fold protein